jgi:putative hydrolase of the HAD superfamily
MSDGYRAVLFDFFGTLTKAVTRGPGHVRVAQLLGCDPAWFTAKLDHSYRARLRGDYGDPATALYRIARQLGRRPSADEVAAAALARRQAIGGDITLRAGAVWTLWMIHTWGLRTALVTDCTQELPEIVAALPIAAHLDAAVYSVELGAAKPDPAMYLTACARLGVSPEQCVYVGDGGGHELTGARKHGMVAVRLAAPDLAEHLVFDADRDWDGPTIVDLRELPELVLPGWQRPAEPYWAHEPGRGELVTASAS